ncbi:oligopeptide transporter substrate-binding protein [Mycobacterium sp. pUA109]|uniref:oligopeptide transporter substrate-binding protein n=1 Tax=Mycobacterium sp. pUA109 TaxID=3238982 RepID=UPI00351AC1E9
MERYGPPDDPSNEPTRYANYGIGPEEQYGYGTPADDYRAPRAEPPAEVPRTPWYLKPAVLMGWGVLVTLLLGAVVWGIVQLMSRDTGGSTSTTTSSTTTTTTSSTAPTSTTAPAAPAPTTTTTTTTTTEPTTTTDTTTTSDTTTSTSDTTTAPTTTSTSAPGAFQLPHMPSQITLPPVPTVINSPGN